MRNRYLSSVLPVALFTSAFTVLLILCLPALAAAADGAPATQSKEVQEFLAKSWFWRYLGAFGFGFITSLTPCVYPMIPIVVGVFGARDQQTSRAQASLLGLLYVLGLGATYAILGVVFAVLGMQFGSLLANPWVIIPICLLYVALAASMFGAFELNLPASVQERMNRVGGKGYGGAFAMGLVGGFTAAPCTGPFLAGILGYVAETRNVLAGSTLLFTYALGLGLLFWVLATFTVSLPKSGRWMEWIKGIGGIALLAVALYFLRPLVPSLETLVIAETWFLVAAIGAIVAGLALGAVHRSFYEGWTGKLQKAAGIVLAVVGITLVINAVLTPDRKLDWQHDQSAAFAQARAEGKGVLIDFAADWCVPCKELELTFADPEVFAAINESFVPLKFDVSKNTEEDEARQAAWQAETLPAVLFVDAGGNELSRVRQYLPAGSFLKALRPAAEQIRARAAGAPEPAAERSQAASGASSGQAQEAPAAEAAGGAPDPAAAGPELAWLSDESAAFARARAEGKGVLIDFYGSWCAPCVELDEQTFRDARVTAAVTERYVPLRVDVSGGTEADRARMKKYGVSVLPAVLFVDAQGRERGRIDSFMAAEELLARMTSLPGLATR